MNLWGNNMRFSKGSEWRRWDLHLHTPETKKNDNYDDSSIDEKWDNFYLKICDYVGDQIDPLRAVCAIGITDYLSIQNYFKVKSDNRLPQYIKLVLPNIEMRMLPAGKSSPVNIHAIFNPEFDLKIEDRFLSKLTFERGRKYHFSQSELACLGKDTFPQRSMTDEEAYSVGLEQFVISHEALTGLLKNDNELKRNTIIVVANSSNDGASAITRHGGSQLTAVRQAVCYPAEMIFSANPEDREYFLGEGVDSAEDVKKQYGSLKPCIHGCDAHNLDDIFSPPNDRFCWIKSDPTFEGLKQIIFEPRDRVQISSTFPERKQNYYVIDRVEIIGNNDFPQEPIYFSDKLTCVIGGKSTGKSLLLHNLALSIDKKQVEIKEETAKTNVKPIVGFNVYWRDQISDQDSTEDMAERKIIYIPQTYLNRLSDKHEETTEIDKIIKDIILQNNKAQKSYEILDHSISVHKKKLTGNILEIIRVNSKINQQKNSKMEIGDEKAIKTNIEKLENEIKLLSELSDISEEDIKGFQEISEQIKLIPRKIANLHSGKTVLEGMEVVVQKVDHAFDHDFEFIALINQNIESVVAEANSQWLDKKWDIIVKIEDAINKYNANLDDYKIKEEALKPKMLSHTQLTSLSKELASEREKFIKISEINNQILSLQSEIDVLIADIAETYNSFKAFYATFADDVNNNPDISSADLEFRLDVVLRVEQLTNKVVNEIFDKNSLTHFKNKFFNNQDLSEEDFTIDTFKDLIAAILTEPKAKGTIRFKNENTIESSLRAIFSDWYNISYIVKMDGDDIYEMSPGKKALVLLRLLISLAESHCPILIDQPEDDLDNRSIFDELIQFMKERKKNRQIIVVTHNANIVLGADAEQVIVANQQGKDSPNKKNRFEYRSGAIENNTPMVKGSGQAEEGILATKGIQAHICEILEGGERAFDLRKNKYRFI